MLDGGLTPLLSFALVIALIPAALWLLKRTPMGGAAQGQGLRTVAVLPLSKKPELTGPAQELLARLQRGKTLLRAERHPFHLGGIAQHTGRQRAA